MVHDSCNSFRRKVPFQGQTLRLRKTLCQPRQKQAATTAGSNHRCPHWPFIQGTIGIITHKYPLYRAYVGISHRGTLVGVHPTIPWFMFFSSYMLDTCKFVLVIVNRPLLVYTKFESIWCLVGISRQSKDIGMLSAYLIRYTYLVKQHNNIGTHISISTGTKLCTEITL